ncbi:MAG: phosphoribosylglycinamide formyltransferase [Psychromonas sp.]
MTVMTTKKIVVLVSGNGTNLQAIIDQLHNTDLNNQRVEVAAVISNKADAYGLQRAQIAGIDNQAVISKGVASSEQYDSALIAAIKPYQPDLIIMAGFMRILTAEFINTFQGKMLNIHPSLLPKYQGLHTHQRAIDAGDSEHGASVHFVTEELDGGPVVLQAKVPVFEEDSAQDLADRVLTQEHAIYPLAAQWFLSNRLNMIDNKAVLDNSVLPINGYAAD